MLSKISWGQFGLSAAILLLLYYLFIGLTVYRKKIRDFMRKRPAQPQVAFTNPAPGPVPPPTADMPTDIVLMEQIQQELRYDLLPRAGSHATKDKLLVLFRQYLSGLNTQNLALPFKTAVNQLMAKEALQQCNIFIDPAEIAALW
ncbi:hypothetical protein MUY27_00190 [Mucilaginibacter sp. RS28]|uniref:Uncharacterized protein n=1 Tax=Mucilaginibacter straminoryzae TaxID=2932774 RepID=A0A9X1WZ51_9SPHI|nr:hypothetical protein [Mucilaginibacter straminoryzae]MCJ8208103.1 hypothetical protein [Mucilaginibacter straminoryzae]